jgi:hypothetical protein
MIRFNNDNIVTGEIKQLLKEFNLPQLRVWKSGIKVFPGIFYIKDNNLCVGVQSGNTVSLQVIKPYIYGENIQNITKNLIVSDNIYDSYTHKYLGDYLRFYRDTRDVNLMSMYNCFANELAKNMNIKTAKFTFDTANDSFKVYMVPVKLFEKYTIGFECDTKIEIIVGLYDNEKVINFSSNQNDTTLYDATYVKKVGTKISSPFLYDKLFNLESILTSPAFGSSVTKFIASQENNLKMFIKVPATSTSSLVVLEGDFVKSSELHFDNDLTYSSRKIAFEVCNFESGTTNIDNQTFTYSGGNTERKYLSRPQLLDFNSTFSYPFALRLIEYIFGNVITSDDEIANNVSRVQKRLVQRYSDYVKDKDGNIVYLLDLNGNYVLSNGTAISIASFNSLPSSDPRKNMRLPVHKYVGMGNIIIKDSIWSTKLRNVIYNAINDSNIENIPNSNKFDLIGYVDKDSEKAIGEYTEVN